MFLDIMLFVSVGFTLLIFGFFTFYFISQFVKEIWHMTWFERRSFLFQFLHIVCETCFFLAVISSPFLFLVWGLS